MRGPNRKKVTIERRLRSTQTDAERKLWFALRDRRLGGHKFVRQEAIGGFVVDFVCRETNLIIEVDGGIWRKRHPNFFWGVRLSTPTRRHDRTQNQNQSTPSL